MPRISPIARSRSGPVGDGLRLILTALVFWAFYFGALYAGIDVRWIQAALASVWVFGIAMGLFKRLWNRTWFWLIVGMGLPVHSLLLWALPNRTPFDVGVSIVIVNLELCGLVALIAHCETIGRMRRHASRQGI